MSANNYQFIQTRNMFRDYLSGYPKNPTFEEWNTADEEDKASLLYVTFYQEITLAWYKVITVPGVVYVSQEDGVSTVLQYLVKNVSKISEDSARYTPGYIYLVCYNCLNSLVLTRTTDRLRSSIECGLDGPHINDGEHSKLDLLSVIPGTSPDFESEVLVDEIWNIIRHMGPKAEKVVNHLINPTDTLRKVRAKSKERESDRLADVSVTKDEYDEIIKELRTQLYPYLEALLST